MQIDLTYLIVWLIFIVCSVFLMYFFGKRIKANKKKRLEAQQAYKDKKEKYTYLKPGILDECPRDEIAAAALFHCIRKENDDFDNYFDNMNHSEKVVYGVYQLSSSIQGQHPSIHSFFLSPATKLYVPFIAECFEELGAHELYDLVRAARRFAEIIEKDLEDDDNDPEMGDYSRYNFSDFTNEYVAMVNSTNLNEKITDYILEHKEDFYDYNIPSEDGDDEDEGISD